MDRQELTERRAELDKLACEMAEDGRRLQEALACTAPGHDYHSCPNCQARLKQIRAQLREPR